MDKEIECLCLSCSKETTHSVLFQNEFWDDGIHGIRDYLAKCAGCGKTTYAVMHWCRDPHGHSFNVYQNDFARAVSAEACLNLPDKIRTAHIETVQAIALKMPMLAGIGLRAIVEAFCRDEGGEGSSLKQKIDALHAKGTLTEGLIKPLHNLRDIIGNKAAHEMYTPEESQLTAALTIVNTVLKIIYDLPQHSQTMISPPQNNLHFGWPC